MFYEIYFEGNLVREDRDFDTEEEAMEDAINIIKYDLCEEWEDTKFEDYEIVIK